jgi:O-acetylhomoserine (thiol)-lyase
MSDTFEFSTLAVHAGQSADPATGACAVPIYQTASFEFDSPEHAAKLFNLEEFGNIYSRIGNPTVAALETRVAALEGGVAALAVASGHAAQFLVFHALMESGDEILASNKLYGGSVNQMSCSFKKFGWNTSFIDPTDPENFKRAMNDKVKAIFIESLANPGGVVTDIQAIADIAHEAGIVLIVDNTLASPYLCRPFEHGADIIVHSLTKFLGGQGNSIGGIIIDSGKFDWLKSDKYPTLTEANDSYHGLKFAEVFGESFGNIAFAIACRVLGLRDLGPCLAPMNAFHILNGIETLPLRMQRHCENAQKTAEFLRNHDKVEWVSYAGLEDNDFHSLQQKYMPKGAGAVMTFGLKGGFEAGVKLVSKVKLFKHLANIGDTRSLVIHPSSTTHRQMEEADQIAAGAGPDVIRISVGIEDIKDILSDLDQALNS